MDDADPATGSGASPGTGTGPTTGTGTGTGHPAHDDRPPSGPRVSREEMKDLGRLRRSVTDRHVAGVAGGIARHLDIDAVIVRVALVVAAFFGGAGLIVYIGAWLLVPEEGTQDEPLGLDRRSRTLALGGVGVLALICALGDWAGAFWFPWPLAIVAALVVWFLHRKDKDTVRPAPATGHDDGYGYGYGYGYGTTTTATPRAPTHPTPPPGSGRRTPPGPGDPGSADRSCSSSPSRSSRSPRASSGSSTSPASRSRTAPTRRSPSGSSRRCSWSARSGVAPVA